ncbi:hypothetical protein MBLNU459_g4099t1 [Dothideomycetes sp. NU459]
MSQWPPVQGPPSTYENEGATDPRFSTGTAHSHYGSNTTTTSSASGSPSARFGPASSNRGVELPPLLQIPSASAGRPSPPAPRSVRLPSVLNPIPAETSLQISRRRKADELDSPYGSAPAPALPSLFTNLGPPSATSSSGASPLSLLTEPTDRYERPRATAGSPVRRATSMTQLGRSTGSINAAHNPFLFAVSPRSQHHGLESATSGAPSLPAHPPGLRQSFGFPSIVHPNEPPRHPSPDHGARTRFSASPSPGYSAYSPGNSADHTSPTGDQSGYLAVNDSSRNQGRTLSVPPATSAGHFPVPISTAPGQNTYQLMTLKTTEGDVRFPVDVQAASRVADEKRKRNAGASARFRERRKKKEIEASVTIAKLEQQLKNVAEDADFYKRERDTLATIVHQMPGGERHFPRPQSPRVRRNVSNPTTSMRGQREEHSPEIGRNVRRRTSSFPMTSTPATQVVSHASQAPVTVYAPPPPPVIPQQPQSQQYFQAQPPVPAPPVMMQSASNAGAAPSHQRANLPPPPPPVMQAQPMTGPYNPFAGRFDTNQPHRTLPHGR